MPLPASAYVCTFCKKCWDDQAKAVACQVTCAAAQTPAPIPAYACEVCGKTFYMEITARLHELRHPAALRRAAMANG